MRYLKIVALALMLAALSVAPAVADVLSWEGGATSTTGYTYTSAEMASMVYYIRIDKPTSQDSTGSSNFNLAGTWYYVGETANGITQWPSNSQFTSLMFSYGLGGQAVQFTVSQVFTDIDGTWESGLGGPITWKSDPTSPFVDTFSPGNGATGTPVGTTSFSFHFKDAGINATGADSSSLTVNCPNFGGSKVCGASGQSCTGTSSDYTVVRSGLLLGYDNVVFCTIYGQDLFSPPNTMSQNYSFTVQPNTNPALAIVTTSLPNGTISQVYSGGPLVATGGHSPYSWAVLSGTFPPGLSLSSSGVPTGTPSTTGTFSFTVRVTDALAATADKTFSITIYPAIPIIISGQDNSTFINSGSPTINYATSNQLRTYVWPTAPANIILVKATTSGIVDNQTITSWIHRLYLTGSDGSGGTNPLPHQYGPVTGTFFIDNVTWANFTATYGAAIGTVNVGLTPEWFDFDVTALAQSAYANGKSDFYFYISPFGGVQDSNRIFASSSYADNTLRPQRIVTTVPAALPILPTTNTNAATGIGTVDATLHGTVNPNGDNTAAWFEWGTNSGLSSFLGTSHQSLGADNAAHSVTVTLSGLTSGSTYYYRAVGTNAFGTQKGMILHFTTAVVNTPPSVTTDAASSVTISGSVLNGTVIPNGLTTTALFEWGTDSGLASYTSTSPQSLGSGATSVAINETLSGLTVGTKYYFRISATNSAGTSRGSIGFFSTSAPPPPPIHYNTISPPTGLSVSSNKPQGSGVNYLQ
jgi:hypothetical protein